MSSSTMFGLSRPLILVLLVLFGCVPGAWGSTAEKLREGCRLLAGSRWHEAELTFREAGRLDRTCVEALVGEGAALLFGGYRDAALLCFERALALNPEFGAALVGLGTTSFIGKNYEGALDAYRRGASREGPYRSEVRAAGAHAACMLGLYAVAEIEAREALGEREDNELALQVLAASLYAQGRVDDALQVLGNSGRPRIWQAVGRITAPSPLYSPGAHYYVVRGLHQREQTIAQHDSAAARDRDAAAHMASDFGRGGLERGDETFRITWPRGGTQVTGRIEVQVEESQNAGVNYIAVTIDNHFAGMSNTRPYRVWVDTAAVADGLREIRVDAYGHDGRVVREAAAVVSVVNAQRTISAGELETRAVVADYLEEQLLLRPHPLARAQLAGHALVSRGRLVEALDAFEYAFSYDPALPGIRADLLELYEKMGIVRERDHEIHRLPGNNVVALTFDDGPHPVLTPWILDLLDRYGAKATFLLIGRQVEMYPELTREIVRRGHEVGGHSYTHSNLRTLTPAGVERELVMTRMMIRRACGEFVTLFRPPGGNYDTVVREAVTRTGHVTVFWNENITSYPGKSGTDILPAMLGKISSNSIVLLHNGYDETTEVLPLLLPALQERGLRMDTVSALTGRTPVRLSRPLISPIDWMLE